MERPEGSGVPNKKVLFSHQEPQSREICRGKFTQDCTATT
jgi:hypothetical protein